MPSPPRIPVELYRYFVQYGDTGDLVILSRVSHAFQHEAEHALYRHVNLERITDGGRLMSWCLAIVGAPRRAHRVHYLKFPTCFQPPQLSPEQPSDSQINESLSDIQNMITQAFEAMINLKELFIVGSPNAGTPSFLLSTLED